MNKPVLTLVIALAVGAIISCLYKSSLPAVIQTQYAALTAPHNLPVKVVATCGCTVDTDEVFPTTPEQIKAAQIKQKRDAALGKLREQQTDSRVRRLIRVGMTRKQVEQIMGAPFMMGTPTVAVKGHPSEDADFYSNYQIAFTAKDIVTSVCRDQF